MVLPVSPHDDNPEYHLTLTDGSSTLGFIFADNASGARDDLAVTELPIQRTAIKTTQGASTYDDLQWPYTAIVQSDWSGGRGKENYDEDTSRYNDAGGLDTSLEGRLFLSGLAQYGTGYRTTNTSMPGSVSWFRLYDSARSIAVSFSAADNYTATCVQALVRKRGSPTGKLYCNLYSDTAGAPGTNLGGYEINVATDLSDTLAQLVAFDVGDISLTASTTYWVVFWHAGGDTKNYIQIGCGSGSGLQYTSSWGAISYAPYYRVSADVNPFSASFFEYKRALYMARVETAGPYLYINGDRGAADPNAGQLDRLIDGSKTWTADAFAGAVVVITAGPGSQEAQPWRVISGNSANGILYVSENWKTYHTTATEYVIIGSNVWTYWANLLYTLTDVAVAGENVYFARGDSISGQYVLRYNEYNNAGTWTIRTANEAEYAVRLLSILHPSDGLTLYGSRSNHAMYANSVWKASVPQYWGALYADIGNLVDTDNPWDARSITDCTQTTTSRHTKVTVNSDFTTGVIAVDNLSTTVDITQGKQLGLKVKSSIAMSSGDLQLVLDDIEDLGRTYTASGLKHYTKQRKYAPSVLEHSTRSDPQAPTVLKFYDSSGSSYADLPKARDGDTATKETPSLDTNDYIYVGFSEPFLPLQIYLGATVNANAAVMTGEYFQGIWRSLPGFTDNTSVTGKTLAQSGTVNWSQFDDWQPFIVDSVEAYYVRLKFSATLTATIDLTDVRVRVDRWGDLSRLLDNVLPLTTSGPALVLTTACHLYVGYSAPFDKVYFDMGSTVNAVASVLSAEYFNGAEWLQVTILDDGTSAAGKTLAQNGYVTLNRPTTWEQFTANGSTGYLVRFKFSATLTADVIIDRIYVVAEQWRDLTQVIDADNNTFVYFTFQQGDYLYIQSDVQFNQVNFQVSGNQNQATLSADYYDGETWTALTITDNTKLGSVPFYFMPCNITFTIPWDWRACKVDGDSGYWIRLYVSASLTPKLEFYETSVTRQNNLAIDLPALTANAWTWAVLDMTPTAWPLPNLAAVKSVGLQVTADKTAFSLEIGEGGVRVLADSLKYARLPADARVNRMIGYITDQSARENPWLITETGVYEIQTQNDDAVVPLPIGELRALRSEDNGQAAAVNDVYLWFNLGPQLVERYFNRNLDDVGPNKDDGLPADRQGTPSALLSHPGRVFLALDGGASNYSSILVHKGGGWHEVYRAPRTGLKIRGMAYQAISGSATGRLWFNQDADLLYIPVNFNPLADSDYQYRYEGSLESGWMYAKLQAVVKFFNTLTAFMQDYSSPTLIASVIGKGQYIEADYQLDDDTTWTPILGQFDQAIEELRISSHNPPDTTGRRFRYRVRFYTDDRTTTPQLRSLVLDTYGVVPVKYSYSFSTLLSEDYQRAMSLWGKHAFVLGVFDDVLAARTQLESWANGAQPLLMNCIYAPYNDKIVILDPTPGRPTAWLPGEHEEHMLNVTVNEI